MFTYKPMTEEECNLARYELLPDGFYDAVVRGCTEKISQSGNNMFEIDLDVFDHNGRPSSVRDYLVFSSKMLWKVKHFCDSAGISSIYEEGKFNDATIALGLNVKVFIKRKEGTEIPFDKLKGKPPGSKYPEKNVVDEYIVEDRLDKDEKPKSDNPLNDEIPF